MKVIITVKSNKFLITLSCLLLIILGGLIGAAIAYNIISHSESRQVYMFDPTKNAKYTIIPVEKEPDNTFDSATPLAPGYETQGHFSSPTDIDIYSFNLAVPGDVRITLKNLPKEYNLFIYDANRLLLASSLRAGFSESTSTISLDNPGKYYIKLIGKGSNINSNYPYTIMVNVMPYFE